MTSTDRARCLASLKAHEGFTPMPVVDRGGTWAVGYGFNFNRWPMSLAEAEYLVNRRFDQRLAELQDAYPLLSSFGGPQQCALVEMSYQIGVAGLLLFSKLLHCLAVGDLNGAALEVENSQLAKQTPERARDYMAMLRETE